MSTHEWSVEGQNFSSRKDAILAIAGKKPNANDKKFISDISEITKISKYYVRQILLGKYPIKKSLKNSGVSPIDIAFPKKIESKQVIKPIKKSKAAINSELAHEIANSLQSKIEKEVKKVLRKRR